MMKRFATLAALTVAALSFAGQANAAYTLTLSALNPTALNANGTQFVFAIPDPMPQTGTIRQPFNVINVAEPAAVAAGSGSVTLSENFSIVGQDATTPGTVTGTLTGSFTVTGATSTFTNFSITNLGGTGGFTVTDISYAQPSVGSSTGSSNSGNISFVITPTAAVVVPEPTSVAILGLGLAGLSVVSFFRRRRHA